MDALVVGDTLDYTDRFVDYPASAGWVLTTRLVPFTPGSPPVEIVATATADDYRTQQTAAQTALWVAGEYTFFKFVQKSGTRVTVDKGLVSIKPNPATIPNYDGRTDNERALADALDAMRGYDASGGAIKRYSIAGREMEFADRTALADEIAFWQGRVNADAVAEAKRRGLADPRKIYIRMQNA